MAALFKNIKRSMAIIVFTLVAFVACLALPQQCFAQARDVTITSESELLQYAILSHNEDTSEWNIKLGNDLEFDSSEMQTVISSAIKHLSFGNSTYPFKGTFDGQGYTIKGLIYENNVFDPERDTGFFAQTENATIKNLNIDGADVWCDFRGGVLIGYAENTHVENVTIINSTLHITCANNALNLITNAGLIGGILVGQMDGGSVYNCEVRGGRAVSNATAGVQALGGEGLYLAALVGYIDGATVEYSRVTPIRNEDGSIASRTDVTNKYDVAVGALGGNNVYASGLIGYMYGESGSPAYVIDCFSTAQCYSYAASYVGVVAVTRAWSGGIAARINGDAANNYIIRSHFAGDLSSRQYNPVAVIPIIQNDVNLGGIASRAETSNVTILNSYYKPSVSTSGNSQGTAADKTLYSIAGDKTAAGLTYGPWSDERYANRDLWEVRDYDFAGGTLRTTANGSDHVNKWVMDDVNDIPVHGQSVKATLDFPGAGSVTISKTVLADEQTTSNPYDFAVSTVLTKTTNAFAEDASVTVTQATNEAGSLVSDTTNNGGYKFTGWYVKSDVDENQIDEDSSWFDWVESSTSVGVEDSYTDDAYEDNDLYVAAYQANVLFHNINGSVINASTGVDDDDVRDDWYRYEASATGAEPTNRGSLSDTAEFIGWTTTPNNGGGYAAIDSVTLAALKNAGAFYEAGEAISVLAPMDLYPVYSDYISNIGVVFEGNEQDVLDDVTQRTGVGKTVISTGTADDGSTTYIIKAQGTQDGSTYNDLTGSGTSQLPDGYRFLGWYETIDGVEVRVSADPTYTLPDDVDLTTAHTYTARFEYRVDYYGTTTKFDDLSDNNPFFDIVDGVRTPKPYASNWQRYSTAFVVRQDAPLDSQDAFTAWYEGVGVVNGDDDSCSNTAVTESTAIVAPLAVHAHVSGTTAHDIYITSDFPGASVLSNSGSPAGTSFTVVSTVNTEPSPGYKFLFWDWERNDNGTISHCGTSDSFSWRTGMHLTTHRYAYTAHLAAYVNVRGFDGSISSTVERLYQQQVLSDTDMTTTYQYAFTGLDISVDPHTSAAISSTPASVSGYKAIGWIDANELSAAELAYVFDEGTCVTSDAAKATPYLITADDVCTAPMDLYPVYVAYDVSYDTNLNRAGVTATDTINVPSVDITPTLTESAGGTATASVSPDITTTVLKSGTELYTITRVDVERDGEVIASLDPNSSNSYSYEIEAGPAYTFVAYYSPLAVVYHVNDSETVVQIAESGSTLGSLDNGTVAGMPDADGELASTVDAAEGGYNAFVGWTTQEPEDGKSYVLYSANPDLVYENTVVTTPIEMWPVYRATTVTVQSNIDDILALSISDLSTIRSLARDTTGSQIALEATASDVDGYDFVGWTTNYEGDLDGTGTYTSLTTSSKDYWLEGDEPFVNGVTYTAIYKKSPLKVNYYGVDGSLLYTASVEADSGRTFQQTVEVPVTDSDGNPTYDANGNEILAEQTVAQDAEAYVAINQQLANQSNSDYQEMFSEWQWVKSDGTIVDWDSFKGVAITESMDLYPVTVQLKALDGSDGAYTSKMTWQIDPSATGELTDTKDNARVKVAFAEAYTDSKLTVNAMRTSYTLSDSGVATSQSAITSENVSLYGSENFTLDNRIDTQATNDSGNAVFTFDSTQSLAITKTTTDADAAGKTFRFVLTKQASGSDAAESRTVSVTLSDEADADGNYTGTTVLMVPFGTYGVTEDITWAWRYTPSFTGLDDNGTVTVSVASADNTSVICANTRKSDADAGVSGAWLDGDARAQNTWSADGTTITRFDGSTSSGN